MSVERPLYATGLLAVRVATGTKLKVAVQLLAPVIVTEPSEQSASPDHPVNVEPADADGERVTTVLYAYWAEQVEPQLIPFGAVNMGAVWMTVPEPAVVTDRV